MSANSALLAGKVAIVTGAAGGIGAESALALAEAGARVVLAGTSAESLEALAKDLVERGHEAAAHVVDIGDEGSVAALVAFTLKRFGRLDVLDNNAAATRLVAEDRDVMGTSVELWDRMMAINARGPMLLCKHALPSMLAQGGGSIINISSGVAHAGDVGMAAYGSSKAALEALTRHVATAYGARGVRCNTIAPGLVVTPTAQATMPEPLMDVVRANCLVPRLGRPRDIADLVVFLASNRSAYITGQVIAVDGGFFAHVPTLSGVRRLMAQGAR